MKKFYIFIFIVLFGLSFYSPIDAKFVSFQVNGGIVSPTCSSSIIDTNTPSSGAYIFGYSMRALKASYATGGGNAVQLQRSSDNTTQNIGFSGCNSNSSASTSFCSTATLAVGTTSSTRVAFPTGSVIHVINEGPSGIFYTSGNGSVTATTASTPLGFNQGVNITVGANTNIAAIIGTGFGINGSAGSATLFLTNCGASILYEQTGSGVGNATQSTLANQLGYNPSCSSGGMPCLFGCLTGCNMHVADSATYKTSTIEIFTVMTFGEPQTGLSNNWNSVGYPNASSSDGSDFRYGLINGSDSDNLTPIVNSAPFNNDPEGFGGVWRGQNLTQYDYNASSSDISIRWNGGTVFFSTALGASPTYPTAVGLYIMGTPSGLGTPGMFTETLGMSATQTGRNTISTNQVSYWGITSGTASSVASTNPLGDGFNWNVQQLGGFAPNPPGPGPFTINGNSYYAESSWNNYTQWQASNAISTGGRLGDLWRFQITGVFDDWDGTNRSENDGSGSAQFNVGTTFWLSYAVYIEPGTPYNSQWNINGQMHTVQSAAICCIFNTMSNTNSGATDVWQVFAYNVTTGSQTFASSTYPITRGRWYHFVYQVLASASGTGDTFNVWLDTVTEGTMVQIASNTGASLFGGNSVNTASYWKYGIYRETEGQLPTFAIRYGNMQICGSGSDCTSKYGVTNLSALATTPLADPSH